MIKRILCIIMASHVGCVHPNQGEVSKGTIVELNADAKQDRDYSRVLERFTRNAVVQKNFESKLVAFVTYLDTDLQHAFNERLIKLLRDRKFALDDATQKMAFFISLSSPEDFRADLAKGLWSITLTLGSEEPIRPKLIKELEDKERWKLFFPYVHNWSREFLVIFDKNKNLANRPVSLFLSNPDAKLEMVWP